MDHGCVLKYGMYCFQNVKRATKIFISLMGHRQGIVNSPWLWEEYSIVLLRPQELYWGGKPLYFHKTEFLLLSHMCILPRHFISQLFHSPGPNPERDRGDVAWNIEAAKVSQSSLGHRTRILYSKFPWSWEVEVLLSLPGETIMLLLFPLDCYKG